MQLDLRGLLGRKVLLAPLARLVLQDRRGLVATQALLVLWDLQVHKASRVLKARKESQVLRAVLLELQDLKVSRVRRDPKVQQALKVLPVCKGRWVSPVRQVDRKVKQDLLVLRDPPVLLVQQVFAELLGQRVIKVQRVLLDPRAPEELLGLLGQQAHADTQVHRVLKVKLVLLVLRVLKEMRVSRELLGLKVLRDLPVSRVPKEMLVSQELLVL